MLDNIIKKLTKDHTQIPLLFINFDIQKYNSTGDKGSCEVKLHPSLKGDEYIKEQINSLIDYIRDNYDMEDLSK